MLVNFRATTPDSRTRLNRKLSELQPLVYQRVSFFVNVVAVLLLLLYFIAAILNSYPKTNSFSEKKLMFVVPAMTLVTSIFSISLLILNNIPQS